MKKYTLYTLYTLAALVAPILGLTVLNLLWRFYGWYGTNVLAITDENGLTIFTAMGIAITAIFLGNFLASSLKGV